MSEYEQLPASSLPVDAPPVVPWLRHIGLPPVVEDESPEVAEPAVAPEPVPLVNGEPPLVPVLAAPPVAPPVAEVLEVAALVVVPVVVAQVQTPKLPSDERI